MRAAGAGGDDVIGAVLDAAAATAEAIIAAAHQLGGDVEAVRRALAAEGQGVYGLGCGGRDPRARTPFDAAGRCDCSGFLCWCWQEPRRDSADGEDEIDGDWINTDALVADAGGAQRFVRPIAPADVRPGDGLVYRGHLPGQPVGHCSVVIARPPVVASFADVTVLHCHGPSGHGPAITRATGGVWNRHGGIAIRRVGR